MSTPRRRFAAKTSVDAGRTKADIERVLTRYGADQFMYAADVAANRAMIGFRIERRYVRIQLPLPDRSTHASTPTGRARTTKAADTAFEQAVRQRWRALLLIITAKLEAVAAGISTIEAEFLAQTLLPNGRTVGEWAGPQLTLMIETGSMPPLLPGGME